MKYLPVAIPLFLFSLAANGVPLSRARCADLLRSELSRIAVAQEDKHSVSANRSRRDLAQAFRSAGSLSVAQNNVVPVPRR